jgi:hypothetical protein
MTTPASKSRWAAAAIPILAGAYFCLLLPQPAAAIPAFARKYGVKCYTCHTIPPALNKTGYTFKRLGYRMLPDEMDGTKPAPKIRDLDKAIKWNVTDSLALITQGSFTVHKTEGDDPKSNSSFNLDEAALFLGGALPENGFSYFAQFEVFQDGETKMEQAVIGYTGGRANSSYFARAGALHLQEGEGTRAAMFYNLFPEPSLVLTSTDPLNFSLDQHPMGIDVGYTWASPYFKRVLGISAKVTNGVNADGSEILFDSTKNSKDAWFDVDYWFGPDGGVTFMTYYGRKDQIQNQGTPSEFTFRPTIRRYGLFGNYLFFDKLDVLGGYLRSRNDWKDAVSGATTDFIVNGYRGEVDYYLRPGFAVMGRYDRLSQTIAAGPVARTQAWALGGEKALTDLGNVIIRATYTHERDTDPVSGSVTTDKLFKLDLRLMW